jgi:hypothetical protein
MQRIALKSEKRMIDEIREVPWQFVYHRDDCENVTLLGVHQKYLNSESWSSIRNGEDYDSRSP